MRKLRRYALIALEVVGAAVTMTCIGYGIRAGFSLMIAVYAGAGAGLWCAAAVFRDLTASLSELD